MRQPEAQMSCCHHFYSMYLPANVSSFLILGVLQVSDQCVKLCKEGWFKSQAEASGVITLVDPRVSVGAQMQDDPHGLLK